MTPVIHFVFSGIDISVGIDINFDDADKATVYRAADEVIEALNQNTVLIEEDEISIEYYGEK